MQPIRLARNCTTPCSNAQRTTNCRRYWYNRGTVEGSRKVVAASSCDWCDVPHLEGASTLCFKQFTPISAQALHHRKLLVCDRLKFVMPHSDTPCWHQQFALS